jgi:hypothetical protein
MLCDVVIKNLICTSDIHTKLVDVCLKGAMLHRLEVEISSILDYINKTSFWHIFCIPAARTTENNLVGR